MDRSLSPTRPSKAAFRIWHARREKAPATLWAPSSSTTSEIAIGPKVACLWSCCAPLGESPFRLAPAHLLPKGTRRHNPKALNLARNIEEVLVSRNQDLCTCRDG
ncbi:hypothetical protein SRM_00299 [Salinibacter ruber M8]|uniref:Uncharacterized protein n=1 Tax=Salinibacter ruber (strain M8) TaxID=761659 RepID=D5H5B5_SALRM|nr:hypothetical protein SRM_00299 [Salinibacter ruber M8]